MDRDELERRLERARQLGATQQQIDAKRTQLLGSGTIKPKPPQSLPSKAVGFVGEVVRPVTDLARAGATGLGVAGAGLVGAGAKAYEGLTGNKTNVDEKALGLANLLFSKGLSQRQQTNLAPTATLGQVVGEGARTGAGVGSFLIPGGKTLTGALGRGALSGGLYGADRGDKFSAGNVVGGALGGAVGGGAIYGGGKAINAIRSGAKSIGGSLANDAVQAYNKATPSAYEKAISEHGLDINKLTKKYVGSGQDYDAVLGGVAKRGRGGVLGNKLKQAEGVINEYVDLAGKDIRIPVDELLTGLKSELKILKRIPGNEKNILDLQQLIAATAKSYKNGFTAKQLLQLKRVADSKFGKAVVDESTGSVTAQFQKMLANSSRSALKKYFKKIGNELEEETEMYTLRPILERARGTLNTQGSVIRQGQVGNIQLLNPISYVNIPSVVFNNSPKLASKAFNTGVKGQVGGEVVKKTLNDLLPASTRPFVGNIPTKVGAGLGTLIFTSGDNNPQKDEQISNAYGNTYQKQEGSDANSQMNHTQSITPEPAQKQTTGPVSFFEARKYGKDMDKMWVVSPDSKTIWNPNTRKWMDFDKTQMPSGQMKLTDKQRSYVGAGALGAEILDILEGSPESVSTGPVTGRLSKLEELLGTEDPKQTQLKSKIASARTAARNALLGANMSDKELESYLDATFDIRLPAPILLERVRTFVGDMKTLAQTNTTGVSTDGGGY